MTLAAGPSTVGTINLLKRFDKDVEEVLASSGHVSLYSMSVSAQQWVRKDVEGSLFVIKRRSAPRFQMLVLNKQSTQNYVEDVHAGMDFEVNPPYLMYTHGNSEIIGVWFYEQKDLHTVEKVLAQIKDNHGAEPPRHVQDFLKQQAELVAQSDTTAAAGRAAPAAPVDASGGDDDDFYDKPKANKPKARQAAPGAAAATPAPTASVDGTSNLANLLRNAGLTPQQQQQPAQQAEPAGAAPAQGSGMPQLLPPSFFAQQRAPAPQQQQPVAFRMPPDAPQGAQPPASGLVTSPMVARRPPAEQPALSPVPPQLQPQASGGAMTGPLAKLFANAYKPGPAKPAAEVAPQAAAAPAAQAPAPQAAAPPTPAPAAPPPTPQPAADGGVSDEEKVRRLLARIATNEGLLKMLSAEMRAVGLL